MTGRRIAGTAEGRWAFEDWRRPLVFLAVLLALVLLANLLSLGSHVERLREWVAGFGPWAPLFYILIHVAGVVATFPNSVLSVAAGALFGSIIGVALVSLASTAGAALAFLGARYFARDRVAGRLGGTEIFRRLDRMTARHGALIVRLARLVPLYPFNLLNYGFGLTGVSFWAYLFWTWLCMLPGTLVYVVGADVFYRMLARGEVSWLLILVPAAALFLTVSLAKRAGVRLGKLQGPAAGGLSSA